MLAALDASVWLPLPLSLCRWERANQIMSVVKADTSLVVTATDDDNSNVAISVRLPINRKELATAAAVRKDKAQALATLLAPYGTADLNGGTVSSLNGYFEPSLVCHRIQQPGLASMRPLKRGLLIARLRHAMPCPPQFNV